MVKTLAGEAGGPARYVVGCPRCGGETGRELRPRWGDPALLAGIEAGIRLVAFDLLLYHLEDAHPDGASGDREA